MRTAPRQQREGGGGLQRRVSLKSPLPQAPALPTSEGRRVPDTIPGSGPEQKSNRQVGKGPSGQCPGWLSSEAESLRQGPPHSSPKTPTLHRAQAALPARPRRRTHKLRQAVQAHVEHRITTWNELDSPLQPKETQHLEILSKSPRITPGSRGKKIPKSQLHLFPICLC